jgi:TRAP-type uncharacterized transport system fused permease subunit
MQKILDNLKHLPTTLAGIGAFLAVLPQIPAVQSIAGLSPVLATKVSAIGGLGAALVLIFGAGAGPKQLVP